MYVRLMKSTALLVMLSASLSACVMHRTEHLPTAIPTVSGKPSTLFALRSIDTKLGTGAMMSSRTCVYAHYTGWLTNGTKFDSSRDTTPDGKPRTPIAFAQGARRVIAGWDVGFEGMHVGGQRRLFIPYQLAYGEIGRPPTIPAKAELIFDVELMDVHKALKPIIDTMMVLIFNKDLDGAIDVYHDIKDSKSKNDYDFREEQLNTLGYQLLQSGMKKDAIEIFKLNVEEFPKSFNVYDSLGEGYMINGDTKLAIKNYEKSLKLNPKNDNAKKMLDKMQQKL